MMKAIPRIAGVLALLAVVCSGALAQAQDNLIVNGGFERWSGGAPEGWRISQLTSAGWEEVELDKSDEAREGDIALSMPNPDTSAGMVIIVQELPAEKVELGKTLVMRLEGQAHTGDQLNFVLSFTNRGREQKVRRIHPGDGAWHELEWMFDVPLDADPETFQVQIMNKQPAGPSVLVDAVAVYFEEIEPLYELPEKARDDER